jgi:hypothetical protein
MVRITMEDGGIIDIELNEEAAPPVRISRSWSVRAFTMA